MNSRRFTSIALSAATLVSLAACGNDSAPAASSQAAPDCALLDPASSSQMPLSEATSIELRTNDVAGATMATEEINVTVTVQRDRQGSYSYDTSGLPQSAGTEFEAIRVIGGEVFTRAAGTTTWAQFSSNNNAPDLAKQFDTSIENAITGSESIATGVYQLQDTVSGSFADWSSWAREEGVVGTDCEYDFKNTTGSTVSVHLDARSRVTFFYYMNSDVRAELRVSYEPVTITKPTDVSDAATEDLTDEASQTEIAAISAFANSLDREIRSTAATSGSSPQDTQALDNIIKSGDLSGEFSITGVTETGVSVQVVPSSEALPATLQRLEISRGDVKVCMTISQDVTTASVITPGGCTW